MSLLTKKGFRQQEASEENTTMQLGCQWGDGVCVGGLGHLQMANMESANSPSMEQSMSGQGDNNERAHSHTTASTSPRCGFCWLHKEVAAWRLEEEVEDT